MPIFIDVFHGFYRTAIVPTFIDIVPFLINIVPTYNLFLIQSSLKIWAKISSSTLYLVNTVYFVNMVYLANTLYLVNTGKVRDNCGDEPKVMG